MYAIRSAGAEVASAPRGILLRLFILVGIVGFAAGAWWAKERIWPYRVLDRFYADLRFYAVETDFYSRSDLMVPLVYQGSGVTLNRKGRAADGLTLMSGMFPDGVGLRLVALDGTVVNAWPVDFWKIWPQPGHVYPASDLPGFRWGYQVQGMAALRDGAVVFNVTGLGLVKMDRCGEVVWTLDRRTHHAVTPVGDGTFWVPAKRDARAVSEAVALPGMRRPADGFASEYEDLLLHVGADGAVLEEFSFLAALVDGGAWSLLYDQPAADPTHVNDIEPVTPALAARIPGVVPGDLLVSARNLHILAIVSRRDGALLWRQAGPWLRQHDPDILPDGTISVFDNGLEALGGSSIVRFDPQSQAATTLFPNRAGDAFFTSIMGTHQQLDNGDLLIAESMRGRVFEVDGRGDTVWQYVQPFDDEVAAIIEDAIRFEPGYFNVRDWSCPS